MTSGFFMGFRVRGALCESSKTAGTAASSLDQQAGTRSRRRGAATLTSGGRSLRIVETLRALAKEGLVATFISVPDLGEAHGDNKAILRARGELVKLITDDDVFWWPGSPACRYFMLANRDIDLMGAAGAGFTGLGLMLRPSALAASGLLKTGVIVVDAEFTMRCTRAGVPLAWHTGHDWAHLGQAISNAAGHSQRGARQLAGLSLAYDVAGQILSRPTTRSRMLHRKLAAARRRLGAGTPPARPPVRGYTEWADVAERAKRWLADWNAQHEASFLSQQ